MEMFSKRDLDEGAKLLADHRILSLLFSGGTYQVEILSSQSPRDVVWPFLQLSDAGSILDAFCSCQVAASKGSCAHLAASYLKVGGKEPLHVRFWQSLWNQIGLISSERHGYEPTCLKRAGKERFEVLSIQGELLFSIEAKKGKSLKKLEELLLNRLLETEENSIKFSNLPQEELTLWREGRPSPRLSYELSFWSDLAKWWMLMQEEGVLYKLSFFGGEPPESLKVEFPDLQIELSIRRENWSQLIPALQTVASPLVAHPYLLGNLIGVTFDRERGLFRVQFEREEPPSEKGIPLGDWKYYPGKGFYPRDYDPLFRKKVIKGKDVSAFFARHLKVIQKFLKDEEIDIDPIPVQYELHFDASYNLIVRGYLFEKGDLEEKEAHYFGDWAYLPEKGFFRLENQIFQAPMQVIERESVSAFISRHRVWLHNFEGFQTHVSGVESHIGYRLDQSQRLIFYTKLEFTEEDEQIIDLGDWILVEGKGFYEKVAARSGAQIKPGMEVPPEGISSFIDANRGELESIHGFFAPICPLRQSGLHIGFNEVGKIQIDPEFFYQTGYGEERVRIFGDYTYVEGEGFHLIPIKSQLPESYKSTKVIDPVMEPYFVSYELDFLYPHALVIDPKLKKPRQMNLRLHGLKNDPGRKAGSWILEVDIETEIGTVTLLDVFEAMKAGRAYLFSIAGLLFLRDRSFDWLRRQTKKRFLKKGSAIRLNTLEFLRLLSVQGLTEPVGSSKKAKETRALLQQFLQFEAPTPIDLSGLKSDLRPYQKTGVDWLWFLQAYNLSGLLCDEMGLGKTHQAMALIAGIQNLHKGRKARFLVVCPTSVIYHWEKLIEKFLPGVKTYLFHGIGRRFEAFTEDTYDLLLTTYGIVRTENKALSGYHFDLAIFDELQVAKNEKSLTHKALVNIEAKMRVGLSGTPIENRLLELKSLFDLVVPTYLPPMNLFREYFVLPIEKHQDREKREMLRRLIHPFLLRRKKSEVLRELPEKFEEVVLCDLSEEQRKLYREIVDQNRDALIQQLSDTTRPPPIAHVFSMISKLKQVCNHPSLIKKDIHEYKEHESGKWDLFLELLSETRDSGQKLVVFSQYLGMLDIIGMHLQAHEIGFAEIRGSTRKRKEEVERFDKDPKCEVFLGSLQAAGVGIDLIAASVVIHYDRWWNPAKENQATDRVHRMGQKRGVQVFKLVSKDTIEEHIHLLIERKLALAGGVIGFDDHDQIKGLDRKELIELLTLLG